MKTPAMVHDFSTRPYPERIASFDYPATNKALIMPQYGAVQRKSYYWVYITAALKG